MALAQAGKGRLGFAGQNGSFGAVERRLAGVLRRFVAPMLLLVAWGCREEIWIVACMVAWFAGLHRLIEALGCDAEVSL